MNTEQIKTDEIDELTEKVIGCAFKVANDLGNGFLEKVYENALTHEMRKLGLVVEQQRALEVRYDGVLVGNYVADIVVANSLLIELKTAKALDDIHTAQCLNYLKATGLPICLLFNFGTPKLEIKRLVGRTFPKGRNHG